MRCTFAPPENRTFVLFLPGAWVRAFVLLGLCKPGWWRQSGRATALNATSSILWHICGLFLLHCYKSTIATFSAILGGKESNW